MPMDYAGLIVVVPIALVALIALANSFKTGRQRGAIAHADAMLELDRRNRKIAKGGQQ